MYFAGVLTAAVAMISPAGMLFAIFQPMSLRENRSNTAAKYNQLR